MFRKILIIRFSSIGDLVLTTPVIRCIKKQTNAEIHFLVKSKFKSVVSGHPYITKLWTIEKSTSEVCDLLKNESFDLIVDLHYNFRSVFLSWQLGIKTIRFQKLNIQKWWMTFLKIDLLPEKHLVDRYFETLQSIDIFNDGEGLDFFIQASDASVLNEIVIPKQFVVGVLGATYATKQIPQSKWEELIPVLDLPVVLLGGPAESDSGDLLYRQWPDRVFNLAGKLTIGQSAVIIRHSEMVITPDTGMMHIAAAFKKPIHVIWGNTIPKFGMFPYMGTNRSKIKYHEVLNLKCRPCSKLGYPSCPEKHFKCMNDQVFTQKSMEIE